MLAEAVESTGGGYFPQVTRDARSLKVPDLPGAHSGAALPVAARPAFVSTAILNFHQLQAAP
jgi:hypothetical protein